MKIHTPRLLGPAIAFFALTGCVSGSLGHRNVSRAAALEDAVALPTDVNLVAVDNAYKQYPEALHALHASIRGNTKESRSAAESCLKDASKIPPDIVKFCSNMVERSYLQEYDLAGWALLQLDRRQNGSSDTGFFPGFELHGLTVGQLESISRERRSIKIVRKPEVALAEPYSRMMQQSSTGQDFRIDVDQVRFNKSEEEIPFGFTVDAMMPFTVLPSTSARMSGVRIIVQDFAKYADNQSGVPLEFSLGMIDDLELAGWHLQNAWVLVSKTIRDNRGNLVAHSIGMDVLVATGGLRVTNERKTHWGAFNSTSCVGELRWGSNAENIRYLIARPERTADWQLLIPAAKRTLGERSLGSQFPLQRDGRLLQDFSSTGGGLDTLSMRYCAPQGVSKIVKDAEQIKGL